MGTLIVCKMSSSNDTQNIKRAQETKRQYLALHDGLSTLDDVNDGNVEQIMDQTCTTVKEARTLFSDFTIDERVKNPRVSYQDSRLLKAASNIVVKCSEAVSGNIHTYDKNELALHIRQNPDFWSFSFPLEVPPAAFLFGTFDPTPPELRLRAPRRQVQRQQAATLKAPKNVDRIEKTEESTQIVNQVQRYIRKKYNNTGAPLSYFETVLDPHSFTNTVENIYYMSFLVQDGNIAVQIDEKLGLPFITPTTANQQDDGEAADKNQFIVSIDMKRWKELVEAFDIRSPAMVLKR